MFNALGLEENYMPRAYFCKNPVLFLLKIEMELPARSKVKWLFKIIAFEILLEWNT